MRAYLQFDLPEEKEEHLTAVHAQDWRSVVECTLDKIRNRLKYDTPIPSAARELEQVRAWIVEELTERGLTTD